MEIIELGKGDLNKLKSIEGQVGRWGLGGMRGTARVTVYGHMGWTDIEHRVSK